MNDSARRGPSLVCVGNLTIDEAVRDGIRNPPAVGGDAAYAALAARLRIEDVTMLAPVGSDFPGDILDALRVRGVRVDDLPTRDLATIRNVVTYHSDGSRTWDMLSTEDDFDVMSVYPPDVPASALASDGILLSAMSLQSQLALTPWLRAQTSALLYLDLQEDYLEGNREALFEIIAASDVFLPSEVEAVALAGTTDLVAAARAFQALGPGVVVIKRAERGSVVLDGETLTEVPADAVTPVDSTGAGDAYCGAFAASHLVTGDAATAARDASQVARVAIGEFGIAGLLNAVTPAHAAEAGS